MAIAATYVDADTFTIVGDETTVFEAGRRVRCACGVDGIKYGTILSSSYSNPDTTVNLTAASNDLTANLATVKYGVIGKGPDDSMPEHIHSETEGAGGYLISKGMTERAQFTWKDADEIYLGVSIYRHMGTKVQTVYWDSALTFVFGSGGSNADSDDLAASGWFYMYLDDSAIVTAASPVITNAQIVAVTAEPTWSDAKRGWYNGNDRCIFAVRTNGSNNVLEFFHDGDFVLFADQIIVTSGVTPSGTWTDSTQTIPGFSQKALTTFFLIYGNTIGKLWWRTNGQTATTGHFCAYVLAANIRPMNTMPVITDSAGIIEYRCDAVGTNSLDIYTEGWYFPKGM